MYDGHYNQYNILFTAIPAGASAIKPITYIMEL